MNTEERIDLLLKSQETLTKLILNSQETAKTAKPDSPAPAAASLNGKKPARRPMSLASREKIAQAQRDRWAKTHAAFGTKGRKAKR